MQHYSLVFGIFVPKYLIDIFNSILWTDQNPTSIFCTEKLNQPKWDECTEKFNPLDQDQSKPHKALSSVRPSVHLSVRRQPCSQNYLS